MNLGNEMQKDIGRCIVYNDNSVSILDAFSCYDGDFYELEYLSGKQKGQKVRINICSDKGMEILKALNSTA